MRRLEWCFDAISRAATLQLNIVATVSYNKEQNAFGFQIKHQAELGGLILMGLDHSNGHSQR